MIPKGPTDKERAEHELTHWPFRSWCGHCAQSRGHDAAHQTTDEGRLAAGLPQIQMDVYSMRTTFEEKALPCLSAIERKSGAICSSMLLSKGFDKFTVELVVQCLQSWIHER